MLPQPFRLASALRVGVLLAGASAPALGASQDPVPDPAAPSTPESGEASEPSAVLIRAARVIVRPGQVLEKASVLVEGGRIVAVGTDVEAPSGARVIEGEVCCAGFLDAWSTAGLTRGGVTDERTDANTESADTFDPYDAISRARALAAGVVAARIQAAGNADIAGLGALVSMAPGTDLESLVLLRDANVGAAIGRTDRNRAADVFDRIGQVDKLAGELHDGIDYGQDTLAYRKDLAAWQEAIAKKEAELQKDFKKAQKDREKEIADAKEKGKEHKEKSYKEDKKPAPPKFDAEKEVFARVANGELPLVVDVHRSGEIRELLAATSAYDRLRLIVAGGTEATLVAERLLEQRVPVIVAPLPLGENRNDELQGNDLGLAGRLDDAGVTVLLGSGGTAESSELPLLALLAVGHGLDRERAFAALTYEAARAFDVADQLGSVAVGRRGDLLVLDGEPLSGGTSVQYVLCGGRIAVSPETRVGK